MDKAERAAVERDLGRTINERDDARRGLVSARRRADDAEAAVERVRAVCDRWRDDGHGEQDRARVEILRALDGEA